MHDITRREFGKKMVVAAGITSLAGLASWRCGALHHKKTLPIAIQLYTVRELSREDFKGTLEKVANIGYPAFEFAGYGGLTAVEVKKLLNDLGVVCAGTHEGFEGLYNRTQEVIDFNAAIGNPYVICPSMPGEYRTGDPNMLQVFAERLNKIGEAVKGGGMQFCYHNHAFEFEMVGGKRMIDILFENTDPNLVQAEVDTFWVQKGGVDPIEFIQQYSGRCPLLHMKDMTNDEEKTFAPVGTGIMDTKGIVTAGKATGTKWYVVEQDRSNTPILEAITTSYNNLAALF